MNKFFIILIAFCFISCGANVVYRDTIIRDTLVTIAPQIYRDTLTLKGDTVVKYAYRFHKKDTVLKIKYYPKSERIEFMYKTDTLRQLVHIPIVKYREAGKDYKTLFFFSLGLSLLLIFFIFKRYRK